MINDVLSESLNKGVLVTSSISSCEDKENPDIEASNAACGLEISKVAMRE